MKSYSKSGSVENHTITYSLPILLHRVIGLALASNKQKISKQSSKICQKWCKNLKKCQKILSKYSYRILIAIYPNSKVPFHVSEISSWAELEIKFKMNPWIIAITSIFCFNLVKSIESEGMFTSSTDLERLLSTEAELVRALKNYLQQEEERLVKLKR